MKKIIINSLEILGITFFLLVSFSYNIEINKDETIAFKTDIKEDGTLPVLKRILAADKNTLSKIKFEKGTYHFYPNKGFQQFAYISNHCDLMVNTPFPIDGFKNLIFAEQGPTFIFHGVMIPFCIDNSANITVKNISKDCNEAFKSEGLIVVNDVKINRFEVEISNEYL